MYSVWTGTNACAYLHGGNEVSKLPKLSQAFSPFGQHLSLRHFLLSALACQYPPTAKPEVRYDSIMGTLYVKLRKGTDKDQFY